MAAIQQARWNDDKGAGLAEAKKRLDEFNRWLQGATDGDEESWGLSEAAEAGQNAMMGMIPGFVPPSAEPPVPN